MNNPLFPQPQGLLSGNPLNNMASNPLSNLSNIAGNPLFAMGMQMMANSQKGPGYRPLMQGVGQAMQSSSRLGMQQAQQAMMRQEYERKRQEREREAAFLKKTAGEGVPGGMALDRKSFTQSLLGSGVPKYAEIGIQNILQPESFTNVGPGSVAYGSQGSVLRGGPSAKNELLTPQAYQQKLDLTRAGRSQTNMFSGAAGELAAIDASTVMTDKQKKTGIDAINRRIKFSGLSPGQREADKTVGKEFMNWRTKRGDVLKQLSQIENSMNRLAGGENLTGPEFAFMPKVVREIFAPDAVNVEEQVAEVVQRNLRAVLGAQFTEREGQLLIARAYNKNLPEAINKKRVARLFASMAQAMQAKDQLMDYYAKNGTVSNFQGRMPTMADFNELVDQMDAELQSVEGTDVSAMSDQNVNI